MARVLIIAYTAYASDGRVRRHAENLAARGDCVDVICLGAAASPRNGAVNVIALGRPRYRGASRGRYLVGYLEFLSRAALLAARLARRHRYHVTIACTLPDAAILAALGPRLFGSRLILDMHDTMPELYLDKFGGNRNSLGPRLLLWQERAAARLADRVFAVHEPHRRRLLQAGIPGEKIVVVANAPDPRIFRPAAGNGAPAHPFTLVYHGTVTHRSGLDIALEAAALLRSRLGGFKVRIIGAGDYMDRVKRTAHALRLDGSVEFLDPVPVDHLPYLLSGAAVGVVPNRASPATQLMLPVKLLEYVSLGIPVVCARLETIEHYFDQSALRFFEPGRADRLAQAIEAVHARPEETRCMIERARTVAAKQLSFEEQRRRYYQTIDTLAAAAP